jgi:hypothetical protein
MDETPSPVVPVNEIRDYLQVNTQVAKLLDTGAGRIRLTGVEGQRLLLSGLAGPWRAVVEVEGRAGPELAAAIHAPELVVIARAAACGRQASSCSAHRGTAWAIARQAG